MEAAETREVQKRPGTGSLAERSLGGTVERSPGSADERSAGSDGREATEAGGSDGLCSMSHCIGEQLTVVFRHSHGVDALPVCPHKEGEKGRSTGVGPSNYTVAAS